MRSEVYPTHRSGDPLCQRKPNFGSVLFHWLSAILVFIALLAGIHAVYYAGCCGATRTSSFLLHAYAGLIVLGLVVVRLILRAYFSWPRSGKMRIYIGGAAASALHVLLYAMMVIIPLTGWIVASAIGCCVFVPGLPNVNDLSLGMKDVSLADVGAAYQVHVFMAWTIIPLVAVHVGAALFHHFILRNDTLRGMLPGWRRNAGTGVSSKNNRSHDIKTERML